jgi:hypothetical protein
VIDNAGAGVSATSEMKIRKPFYFSQLVPSNFQNKGFKGLQPFFILFKRPTDRKFYFLPFYPVVPLILTKKLKVN